LSGLPSSIKNFDVISEENVYFIQEIIFLDTRDEKIENAKSILKVEYDQILSTFKFTDSDTASDESSDLNTYSNDSLTFEYPNFLTLEYGFITGENPTIQIYSATSSEPLSNECMELVRTENSNGLKIKYYKKIVSNSGFACSDPDGTPREIWITGENGFAPGTVISYSVTEETEALKIFDQIISTFKFTDSNNN